MQGVEYILASRTPKINHFFNAKDMVLQDFSLPPAIIRYIHVDNITDEYQDLIQTCKYFFANNPILVTAKLCYDSARMCDHIVDDWIVCDEEEETCPNWDLCHHNFLPKKYPHKLWVHDSMVFNYYTSTKTLLSPDLSTSLPKIYRANIDRLVLINCTINLEEFKMIAASPKNVHLYTTEVIQDEKGTVPFEDIIKACSNLDAFDHVDDDSATSYTPETAKNLLKIPHFKNISVFQIEIDEVDEDCFNIEDFYEFIKVNKTMLIQLKSENNFFSDEYKGRLNVVIDKILAAAKDGDDFRIPLITFNGDDEERRLLLTDLHEKDTKNFLDEESESNS